MVALPPDQRAVALDRLRQEDASLCDRLLILLKAHDAAGDFLEAPLTAAWPERPPPLPGPSDLIGTRIGPYELLEVLGEGGFGAVYRAQQHDPVQRQVALKIIKLGMDTAQVIARFEAERQVLALMDHPGIAKVFDAGVTDTGRPYFVMELVDGEPITDYCDRHNLSTPQRLELFMEVCGALQHAHQKGVIHRDLKPSNVMVRAASDDSSRGTMQVTIIDFGIAKATQHRLTEKTMVTEIGQFIGTPAYMSPEQAEPDAVDIDTRSDIYSLGVLLYELLTGTTPFDTNWLRLKALIEIQRIIREDEPPKPSTRLSRLGDDETEVTRRRDDHPSRLSRALRGDLDWIVMKALEKDRNRRYESAGGLAMDIRRHLNHEPVEAGPPSATYRLGKLIRRHKGAVAAMIAIATLLIGGIVGTTTSLVRALEAEGDARDEAFVAQQVSDFLTELFAAPDPHASPGETFTARELLDRGAQRIEESLSAQPEVQARLMDTMGAAYFGLGAYPESRTMLEASMEIRRAHYGPRHESVADALTHLGKLLYELGEYEAVIEHTEEALDINRETRGDESLEVARNLNDLGWIAHERGDHAESIRLHQESLDIRRAVHGDEHLDIAESLNNLAAALHQRGDYDESERLYRESLAMRRALFDGDHPLISYSLNNLATLLEAKGDLEGAESVYREGLALSRRLFGEGHPDTATGLVNFGRLLTRMGKYDAAESNLLLAIDIDRAARGDQHPYVAYDLRHLGQLRLERGDHGGAEESLREALAIYRATVPEGDFSFPSVLNPLAQVLLVTDRAEEAEPMAVESVRILEATYPPGHRRIAAGQFTLGRCRSRLGQYDLAEQMLITCQAGLDDGYGQDGPEALDGLRERLALYRAWERPEQARSTLRELIVRTRRVGDMPDANAASLHRVAVLLLTCEPADLRDPENALKYAERASEISAHENVRHLRTLALACHRTRQPGRAVEYQTKAIFLNPSDEPDAAEMQRELAEYHADVVSDPDEPS